MRLLLLFTFFTFFYSASYAEPLTQENISFNIIQSLETRIKGENKPLIQQIYQQTGNKALWIGKINEKKSSELIQALNNPLFNYKNKAFDQASISKLYYLLDNNEIPYEKKASVYARLDLLLTNSMVRLVRFIVQGDVDWDLVQSKFLALKESDDISVNWEMKPKNFPNIDLVIKAIQEGTIYQYLTTLIPMEKRYKKLIKLLKNYRVMNKFPKIPYSNTILKIGDKANRIKEIKKRLQISGDYPQNIKIDSTFDLALQKAVTTYQKRYLLEITGTIDKTVTYYLNQPVSKNIQAIITNLDKTKLYPKEFEDEYIEVNIPDFNLRYYVHQKMVQKMGVVVGRIDRPTPLFSDKIDYMVLNPTWTIPDNLIKRDLIHVLRENPNYLEEHNIHVFRGKKEIHITQEMLDPYEKSTKHVPYRFVQYPGEDNALGKVKFMFPNKYAVYLHDTDNKTLYNRRYKIYSSGCMRVEKPFDLMYRLLAYAKGNYNKEKIDFILQSNKPKTIRLTHSIPVHILYFTVYEENGLAYFKNDIYLYDMIIEESIKGQSKALFSIPKNRMISIKKQKQKQKPLTN